MKQERSVLYVSIYSQNTPDVYVYVLTQLPTIHKSKHGEKT